jgi:hypothetical protein
MVGLSLLLDGIGLAMITGATILEGMEMWKEHFKPSWDDNSVSIRFWMVGRSLQILGLLFLIGNIH